MESHGKISVAGKSMQLAHREPKLPWLKSSIVKPLLNALYCMYAIYSRTFSKGVPLITPRHPMAPRVTKLFYCLSCLLDNITPGY